LAEDQAGGELLAAAVVQISEVQRLAAGQLQAGQAQRALAAGDGQPIPARFEDVSRLALPGTEARGVNLQRLAAKRGVTDRPRG